MTKSWVKRPEEKAMETRGSKEVATRARKPGKAATAGVGEPTFLSLFAFLFSMAFLSLLIFLTSKQAFFSTFDKPF